jgi:hypothetical protein
VLETFESTPTGNKHNVDRCKKETMRVILELNGIIKEI